MADYTFDVTFDDSGELISGGIVTGNTIEGQIVGGPEGPRGDTGPQGDPGVVQAVVAGTNVTVDSTDPANPIINTSATVNDTDANLKARANHTGTQTASTISDFDTEVSNNTDVTANTSARHSHANKSLLDTYTQTNVDLADAVAKKHTIVDISGKADTSTLTAHTSNTSNPHSVTKAQVGLGSVPNTDFTSAVAGKEDVANKSTTTTLGTSDTLYPSQKAVKTYVDNNNTATLTSYDNTVMTGIGVTPATTTQEAVDNFATAMVGALGGLAVDGDVVHNTGNETVAGNKTLTGLTTLSADSGTSTEGGVKIEGTADNVYLHVRGPTSQPFRLTDTRSNNAFRGAGFLAGLGNGTATTSGSRLGYNIFFGNDGANAANATVIAGYASADWSVGVNPAHLVFSTKDTATAVERMRMGGSATAGVTINEQGLNHDFRVEGDTDQNLLFTDASADKIGIGTATPASKLHVDGGDIEVDDIASGVIIKSANGTRWRITVDNDGSLTTASI